MFLFLTIIISFFTLEERNKPQWLDYRFRANEYPKEIFYQGFVSRNYQDEESRIEIENEIITQSRVRIAESVFVFISSESKTLLSNINTASDVQYQRKSITRTELEASELESLVYFDERKHIAYAFSFVKKRKLQSSYYRTFKEIMASIKSNLEDSVSTNSSLTDLLDDLDRAKSLQQMLRYLGINNSMVLQATEWNVMRDEVIQKIDAMQRKGVSSLADAARFLRDGLLADIESHTLSSIKINKMTFKNTGIATELSILFDDYFQDFLAEKLDVTTNSFDWEVNTTCWPLNDQLKITSKIHESEKGELVRLVASTSVMVPLSIIEELEVDFIPLKSQREVLAYQSLTDISQVGEIMVDIVTQKGNESLVFEEGETLKLSIKASRAAYIQLVNVWADGSKLLLLDNFYLNNNQTNHYVELPFSWETACPCGVEYVYAIASSSPHDVPRTTNNDGFLFISDPLDGFLSKKRGFKNTEPGSYASEDYLIVTTVEKK